MSNTAFKNGMADASKNKGPKSPTSFNTVRDRKEYEAGYNKVKYKKY